jgi:hypothetical protein
MATLTDLLTNRLTDPLTDFSARPIRWGGLKGIKKILRPYKSPQIISSHTTFIKLPYTMTPFPLLLFNLKSHSQIFFFAENSTTFG